MGGRGYRSIAASAVLSLSLLLLNDGVPGTAYEWLGGGTRTTTSYPFSSDSCGWNCNTSTTTRAPYYRRNRRRTAAFKGYTTTTTPATDDWYSTSTYSYYADAYNWDSNTSLSTPYIKYRDRPRTTTTTLRPYHYDDGSHNGGYSVGYPFDSYGGYSYTSTTTMNPRLDPKYPTRIIEVREPSMDERVRCKFTVPVSEITRGKRTVLVRGTSRVYAKNGGNEILIEGVSEDQRPPTTSIGSSILRAIRDVVFGTNELYRYSLPVPRGCMHFPYDPGAMAADAFIGLDVTAVMIKLSPEVFVSYGQSYADPPLSPSPFYFGKNAFRQFDFCLFGMEISRQIVPGSIHLAASARTAAVDARDPHTGRFMRIETFEFPCECKPQRMGLISWWIDSSPDGNPTVLLYVGHDGIWRSSRCYSEEIQKGSISDMDKWVAYYNTSYFRKN